jgi:hypothetical protein
MDLLYALGDLGVVEPAVEDAGDQRARLALAQEIERATDPDTSTRRVRVLRRRRPDRPRFRGRRRVGALVTAGVLIACSGVAVATLVDPTSTVDVASPAQFFADNPTAWNQDNLPNSNTPIVAGSVKELGTINVPGVGAFQYWVAQTSDSQPAYTVTSDAKWCAAFRAPDGTWAGATGYADDNIQPNYAFGGEVPGCGVLRTTQADGFDMSGGGFHINSDTISPLPDAQNTSSWIYYGYIDNPGSATTVLDATSGARTPLLAGGFFALVMPPQHAYPVRLEAVDGSGNVITQAYPFGGNTPLAPAVLAQRAKQQLTRARTARSAAQRQGALLVYREVEVRIVSSRAFFAARSAGARRAALLAYREGRLPTAARPARSARTRHARTRASRRRARSRG